MITAAADTILQDGREVCILRAFDLQPGDVIQADGRVDIHVTGIQTYPAHNLVVAEYACTAGVGARTLVASSFQAIQPRVWHEEEDH